MPLVQPIHEATYEATLIAAMLNKARNGSNILFLTMIGGGVFGNQPEWIIDAIRRTLRLHHHSGLDVRLVSHHHPNSMLDAHAAEFRVTFTLESSSKAHDFRWNSVKSSGSTVNLQS